MGLTFPCVGGKTFFDLKKAKLSMNGINVPSQDPLRVGSDQITTDYEKSSRDSRDSRDSRSSSISTLGDSTSLSREYD